MLGQLLDECLTRINRKQVPARLLEALVTDLPESDIFPLSARDDSSIGIYIHIPFCATKCSFCGYSVELDRSASLKTEYARAIRTHLQRLAPLLRTHRLGWVSFGGGTPSSLSASELAIVLDGLVGFKKADDLSISMEMRVDSLEEEQKLQGYIDLGINRVCLGVQSFDDRVRKSFGLRLEADEVYRLLTKVKESGVEYAFDLIWGGPHQSNADLDVTLDRMFSLEPHQIDAYPLFPIKGTSMFKLFERMQESELKAHQRALCDHVVRRMASAGYERIDGVMFSRTKDVAEDPRGGFREASSLLVPETGHIIGVGQSAHTLYAGTFATNPYSARKYVEMINEGQELTYTGLRAPLMMGAFRSLVARLTRGGQLGAGRRPAGPPSDRDLEKTFYNIRFWWHVFTGLRGWNALSGKVGYPIGNESSVRINAKPRYVTREEFSKSKGATVRRKGPISLPVLD